MFHLSKVENPHLRIVHIGNVAMGNDSVIYCLKNYSIFYEELAGVEEKIKVFAGFIKEGETGYSFLNEKKLNKKIQFVLSRGNTSETDSVGFLYNNMRMLIKLLFFSGGKQNYFVFLPSPLGVWSIIWIAFFNRRRSLGIYIGGYFALEQSNEYRKEGLVRFIKKVIAKKIDQLVIYAIKKSDYVITSSYEYFEHYKHLNKIYLTPPLINVEEADLTTQRVIERAEKYITFCGELRHAKGVVDLVKAFIILVKGKKIAEYKLKIIGSGQAYDELNELVSQNGIQDLVIFCGQIKDEWRLKAEIKSSTIFVLPSYSEGFPRVAYECFTLGVPTILTPVGGIPFFVTDREHCLFCTPGDVQSIANTINVLADDDVLRAKISANAKSIMRETVFPRIRQEGSLAKMIYKRIVNLKAKE